MGNNTSKSIKAKTFHFASGGNVILEADSLHYGEDDHGMAIVRGRNLRASGRQATIYLHHVAWVESGVAADPDAPRVFIGGMEPEFRAGSMLDRAMRGPDDDSLGAPMVSGGVQVTIEADDAPLRAELDRAARLAAQRQAQRS